MASTDETVPASANPPGSPKSFKSARSHTSARSPVRSPSRAARPPEPGSPPTGGPAEGREPAEEREPADEAAETTEATQPAPAAPEEEHHPQLEADPDVASDTASNYGYASDVSDTASATSSIFHYQYENGRRYHAYRAGQYLLPNDDKEQERLDMTHHVFLLTLKGELCATRLQNPQNILDIGTGTGIWAIEVGDLFPSAQVIGTDLSPIQPDWVPPNVCFEIDDATLEWTFPKNHFDFIHARTLAGAVKDWPALLRQCYEHCRPGGRVEISEGRADFFCDDDTLGKDTATWQWLSEFRRLSAPLGFDIAPALPDMLRAEGFEQVDTAQSVVPMGTWPRDKGLREIGRWFRVQFLDMALEAYTLALFTRAGNWSNAEVQVLLALVRAELKSDEIHLYTYT
ncbi:Secondary metabolism regulator LAE1 [Colletotrichum shisoi]|uniref:Secondary metabolism regulator LAE1 n=1 Tax=Colletotrichum shisoi TaxID=2078593 RepID=A0A5Q4BFV6_9PEZI|nr:Secondary metabolism regulator LAE1 [Colletotrichum shisoi]